MDVLTETNKNRPDTKWRLGLLINIRVKVYSTNYVLGAVKQTPLPERVKNSEAIVPLDKDPVTYYKFKDNLCAFRCLSLHLRGDVCREKVLELYSQWMTYRDDGVDASSFKGVQLRQLPDFQKCFEVNVQINELCEDGIT